MAGVPRRRLSEIVVDVQLRGRARYVIVEGLNDKIILRSYFEGEGVDCSVLSVDDIEFEHNISDGEGGYKGIIRRAAARLREEGIDGILFAMDRDLEKFSDFLVAPNLIVTDLVSLELYCVDREHLAEYCRRVFDLEQGQAVIDNILEVCADLYVVKLMKENYCHGKPMVTTRASLDIRNSVLTFDVVDLISRQRSVGCDKPMDALAAEFSERRSQLEGDPRSHIFVHDLAAIFVFLIRRLKPGREMSSRWIYDYILGHATHNTLRMSQFFRELGGHVAR